ncbi:MAG: amidohydrolase family protein [Candidatus Eremiobacteraeota bacterium]|nr:amidohydrolase family protein [Candidatus Eremiobacteraeota bacterium]
MSTLHRGHVFHLTGRPSLEEAVDALVEIPDGAILVSDDGIIEWCGRHVDRPSPTGAPVKVVDHRDCFILPGFIDTHIHFPQLNSIDAYGGGQLLEWLTACIFPAEAKFRNEEYALGAARAFCNRLISAGTTTSLVYGSQFPPAQEALFAEYRERGLRGVIGRTIQTTGPDAARPLMTGEDEAIRLTGEEIERWHPPTAEQLRESLLAVAVIPRFSLAVTAKTLEALGELYSAYRGRGVYFTSHLNENNRPQNGEIAGVLSEYGVEAYLDTYDGRFLPGSRKGGESLLGRRSVLAHCVHCQDRELERMAETGTSVAHCPVSQLFLGSGTMPWRRTAASGVTISAGTDFAAGDSWFMLDVVNMAYKVHLSEAGEEAAAIHPARLLHMLTAGGARALDLEDRIGNFDVGREADLVVIDPHRWEPLIYALEWGLRSDDPVKRMHGRLYTVLMATREVAVTESYVKGRKLTPGPPR